MTLAPSTKEDSQLMLDALTAIRFLVDMKEAETACFTNEQILAGFQKMADDKVIDILSAAVVFSIELAKNGFLKRPDHFPPKNAPVANRSGIILPPSAR